MRISNIHERRIDSTAEEAGALLDSVSSAEDRLWPRRWPRQTLDRPLGVGAVGGHGPIHYVVEAYEPGRHVAWRFTEPTPLRGRHWFDVVPADGAGGVWIRHVVAAESGFFGWLWWALGIRWLHDALLRDALDRAEGALTGHVRSPARWSPWVRFLRFVAR